MEFRNYDGSMKPQVVRLFSREYGTPDAEVARRLDHFFEHPFQKERCLALVAMNGQQVIGFQGVFYWPYMFDGKLYRSLQAGNSLVHPDFRGRGVFQKLLQYTDERVNALQADFMLGFANKRSRNSYVRNNWQNILDLRWYVKVINPVKSFFKAGPLNLSDEFDYSRGCVVDTPGRFVLAKNDDVINWRTSYPGSSAYAYYSCGNKHQATFALKFLSRRKRLRELMIGDFRCDTNDANFIRQSFKSLILKTRRLKSISILTIALSSSGNALATTLAQLGFRATNKRLHFILKNLSGDESVCRPELWNPYYADGDVW